MMIPLTLTDLALPLLLMVNEPNVTIFRRFDPMTPLNTYHDCLPPGESVVVSFTHLDCSTKEADEYGYVGVFMKGRYKDL